MSYNYSGYQTALATLMATTTTDSFFTTILPNCIDYAEQRIYRELDFLNSRFTDTSTATAAGTRNITFINTLIVLETIAVFTPAGTGPTTGTRVQLSPATHDFIDAVYPSALVASQATPQYFAMVGQQQALLGPCPDAAYTVEIIGTYRPAPLSGSNTTTPLTVLLPDLFLAASMIFMAGYQKNFGAQADDPKMAVSWESQYQTLMVSAKSEEFRKKFQSETWTSQINSPVAGKQRG